MGQPAQKGRQFLAVHHYWLLDFGEGGTSIVQNLSDGTAMLGLVSVTFAEFEFVELAQLDLFDHFDEIARTDGSYALVWSSVAYSGYLICHELDKFAPLDPTVTVDVDFFEQLNRSIHQIESF